MNNPHTYGSTAWFAHNTLNSMIIISEKLADSNDNNVKHDCIRTLTNYAWSLWNDYRAIEEKQNRR